MLKPPTGKAMTGIGFWCVTLHGERSEPCNVGQQKLFTSIWLHYFALGNKSGGFCEAVNCERSEQEGKFLFAYLMVPILWFPPPSKASWHNARESAESSGTIHLEMDFTPKVY